MSGVRRPERKCPLCGTGVEDEMHMMVDCPAYEHHRLSNADMCAAPQGGWTDTEFRKRMNGGTREHWEGMASFVRSCLETRANKLEQNNSAGAAN